MEYMHYFTLGESLDVKSPPRSSWGVTKPDELYTLIFRLGSGSRRGELVIGILSETSWRAYTGPRYMAAAFVKSGGAVSRSAGGMKRDGGSGADTGEEILMTQNTTLCRHLNMRLYMYTEMYKYFYNIIFRCIQYKNKNKCVITEEH